MIYRRVAVGERTADTSCCDKRRTPLRGWGSLWPHQRGLTATSKSSSRLRRFTTQEPRNCQTEGNDSVGISPWEGESHKTHPSASLRAGYAAPPVDFPRTPQLPNRRQFWAHPVAKGRRQGWGTPAIVSPFGLSITPLTEVGRGTVGSGIYGSCQSRE